MSNKHQPTLNKLKSLGFVTAQIEFSGGNDEGGVDDITLTRADGTTVTYPNYLDTVVREWSEDRKRWVETTRPGPDGVDSELHTALVDPVYSRFHTFAGEFHVDGKVEFNVQTNMVKMTGYETIEQYHDLDEEV